MFYVTTTSGEKIRDATHCEQIQETIRKAVNAFLDGGHKAIAGFLKVASFMTARKLRYCGRVLGVGDLGN